MASISKLVESYVYQHQAIKDCMANRLVNFSSLARLIIKDEKIDERSFNAVLVAANRLSYKLEKSKKNTKVKNLLKQSRLNIKTNLCRFVFVPHASIYEDIEPLHLIKGNAAITVIVDEAHYDTIANHYEHYILSKEKGLVEIALVSPAEADAVPGLTSYLSGLLASKGINIITMLGSYTDDVFIIKKEDLAAALAVLNKSVG